MLLVNFVKSEEEYLQGIAQPKAKPLRKTRITCYGRIDIT